MGESTPRAPTGVPPGLLEAVLAILRGTPGPVRRRAILRELETRGHRVSLAGLNRALDHTDRAGLTRESPDGVVLIAPPTGPRGPTASPGRSRD
jgi:hypothetical protein